MKKYFSMILGSLYISFFISACANVSNTPRSNENLHKQKTSSQKEKSSQKNKIKTHFSLKVVPDPSGARIRILNIRPKYKDNIILKRGKYLIEVSKPGYIMSKKWIRLEKDRVIPIRLKKRINHFKPNGEMVWSSVKLDPQFNKYSRKMALNTNKLGTFGRTVFYIKESEAMRYKEAVRFCRRLNFQGLSWRLPTGREGPRYFKIAPLYYNVPNRNIFISSREILRSNGYVWPIQYNQSYCICVARSNSIKNKLTLLQTASDIYKTKKKMFTQVKENDLKLEALKDAFFIKYGIPQIDNIHYDATKEVFNMDLVSSKLKSISVKDPKRLINASNDENTKVYITKNGTLIQYFSEYIRSRGINLDQLDHFNHVTVSNKNKDVYDQTFRFINTKIHKNDKINIYISNQKNGYYNIGDILQSKSLKLGERKVHYNPQVLSDTFIQKKYKYKKHIQIHIPKEYAETFKNSITKKGFIPEVVFDVKDGKAVFKYIKTFKDIDTFIDDLAYNDALSDLSKLKRYLKDHKTSKHYLNAKKRYMTLSKFYKGYTPKTPFYIEGCKGFYPSGLIAKLLEKKQDKYLFTLDHWGKITWTGLCRRGLLSGRGDLVFETNNANEYIKFENIYMKEGFIIDKVKAEYSKHVSGIFWKSTSTNANVKLDTYEDFQNYQKGLR